jgi:SEC-C motif-containing protein
MNKHCICGSQKFIANCCERFLSGREIAKTPEQLMRSRYSAYALGGYGQYLLDTWLPATSAGLSAEQLSTRENQWIELIVLNKSQQADSAMVEFEASYRDSSGVYHCLHEKSVFTRQRGRWIYVGGEIS